MSPDSLPVANSTKSYAAAASRKAETSTTLNTTTNKMANSNVSYRQTMGAATTKSQNTAAAAAAAVTSTAATTTPLPISTKQSKALATKDALNKVKEMSSSSATSALPSSATNVIMSQCDSSSGSSTTSSNGGSSSSSSSTSSSSGRSNSNHSDINSINVKSETCDTEIKTEMDESDLVNGDAGAQGDLNDLQLVAAMKHRPILLSTMNAHIICGLCFGYLIDATTIVECLHSFCHSCLIQHLRTEQYCPRCEMMINTAKPNIKPDTTLQAIVYKLVPGLYEKELMRKRAFYKDRPEDAALATPEQRGDDTEHLIFSPSDYMSISLEYADMDDLMKSNSEYNELLRPRYLQCPAMCTVAHLKKLVFGKFEINSNRFTIDIMYKVKTIILLDHYTLMDVAYIYTWKRDAPMRFYFRVKQSLRPAIRVKKNLIIATTTKKEVAAIAVESTPATVAAAALLPQAMCIVHEPTPSTLTTTEDSKILEPEEIKQEDEAEVSSTTETLPASVEKPKQFEIVQPQSPSISSQDSSPTDKLKITIVNKAAKDKSQYNEIKSSSGNMKPTKEKKENHKSTVTLPKDERKVENIKLKIDLSKQNSVTIINMSDPERKEIVKSVKPEKEWKVTKTKKEKDGSPKSSPKSSPHSERKSKTPSPLTVPPITIKAERISPLAKPNSPNTPTSSKDSPEDIKKSQFLKSFALAPINEVKLDKPQASRLLSKEVTLSVVPKNPQKELHSSSSKRKSKEPIKAVIKKPKLSPPLATEDFKIKLPPIQSNASKLHSPAAANVTSSSSTNSSASASASKKQLMPPPAPLAVMKPPASLLKKTTKLQQAKVTAAPPGSLTPHPMHRGIQLAPPGSRTPIAKRYQPILPKTSRPNPFANIPSDVNKILKDAGTEIKSIPNEPITPKVYGPKTESTTLMGPPPAMTAPTAKQSSNNSSSQSRNNGSSSKSSVTNKNNSYLNLALFNASKSKGNEVPPGCRTPMYTPNSPIYSPSSPQYVPNYNIPTVPTYKYTPKPNNSSNSYLQSVLNSSQQMSSLFPSPPTKKESMNNNSNNSNGNNSNSSANNRLEPPAPPKRIYPFARSPSPIEDPPEKQLKVKSLLNSCNINIPSSLSITITREDGDASSNGAQYPKRKSPVNNYIEILKLPEQTADNSDNKSSPPPSMASSLFPNPPVKRVATPPLNSCKTGNNSNSAGMPASGMNLKSLPGNPGNLNSNNQQLMSKTNGLTNKTAPPNNNNKSPVPPPVLKPAPVQVKTDNKTPSPEKRLSTGSAEQKSPKSPDGMASKKFRHILPRQIGSGGGAQQLEINVPKQNGNVIGTYASPTGINVKIHSNKKVLPSKKSPGGGAGSQQKIQPLAAAPMPGGVAQNPLQSPTSGANNNNNNNNKQSSAKSPQGLKVKQGNSCHSPVNVNNKSGSVTNLPTMPAPTPPPNNTPVLPHPMQAILPTHLGTAASQAELSKLLTENLLRAQVQAAVANKSNMFYPYAANAAAAAQLGQFNPTMYNYQQAYIMDQLARMQRAGNDAFTEYMQKLKNSMELQKSQAEAKGSNNNEVAAKVGQQQKTNTTSPKSATTSPTTTTNMTKNGIEGKTK